MKMQRKTQRRVSQLLAAAVIGLGTTVPSVSARATETPLLCSNGCSDFCTFNICGVCNWQACYYGCYDSDGEWWQYYVVCTF